MIHALALALLASAFPQDGAAPDEKKVRALVEKLNSDDANERNQAEADLAALGEAVVPHLEKARPGAGAEARGRIDNVIADVTLARRWLKDLSEEGDAGQAYQRLEQAFTSKTLDRRQLARIVSHILVSEPGGNLQQYMFSLAERHRLREVWPALVHLIARDEAEGYNVISHLQRLKPPREAVDEILKLLPKVRNRSSFSQILELTIQLKPDRARLDAAVSALLDAGADDEVRQHLLSSLQQGRLPVSLKTALKCWRGSRSMRNSYGREGVLRIPPDDSVGEIVAMLKSDEAEEVMLAAEYVARHKVAQAAATLVEALEKHPTEGDAEGQFRRFVVRPRGYGYDGSVRARLLQTLKELGPEKRVKEWLAAPAGAPPRRVLASLIGDLELRGLAEELQAFLEDKDPAVRKEAAEAAADLKLAEAAPRLEALLKDGDLTVRVAGLRALAKVRGAAATPAVLAQLRAESPDVRAAAVELLPQMDLDAVLNELTRPESLGQPFLRYALASLITSTGESGMHRVMARVGDKLTTDDFLALVRLIQAARGR